MNLKKLIIFLLILTSQFSSVSSSAFAQEISPTTTTEPLAPVNLDTSTPTLSEEPTPTGLSTIASSELLSPVPDNVFENINSQTSSLTLTTTNGQDSQSSAAFSHPVKVHQLYKKNFKGDEKVTITVENTTVSDLTVSLFDVDGNNVGVKYEQVNSESPAVIRLIPPSQFKAGRYRLVITDATGTQTTQDFTWGVLAINPNKSVYAPNETANIAMAVLDETGEMVCDANVELRITNQELGINDTLSTSNGKIKVNSECNFKDFTLTPDYQAFYQVGGAGNYRLTLTAKTKNGTYSEDDFFNVDNNAPFDVERINATRLYPPLTYPSVFNITANQDFQGTITEKVPDAFAVSQLGDGTDPFDVASNSADFDNITSDASSSAIPNLSLPFDGNYAISQKFGQELRDPIEGKKYADFGLIGHDGVDFDLPIGTPVLAADTGEVIMADENGPYGTTVVIQHSWGRSYYGHLSFMTAQLGQTILRGHPMGMSGNTGLSTGPHLHFGIKPTQNNLNNGYYGKINPLPYLGLEGFNGPNSNVFYSTASSYNYGEKLLTWDVNLKKGDKIKLGYNYKAPNISPQFYLLGPLEFRASESSALVFQETRQWQLAVDADGSGTNIVSPTTGTISTTGNTYTFTFTAAETMSSGGIQITVPSGWTAPQTTTAGSAGYTTVSSTGITGKVEDTMDSSTGWSPGTACLVMDPIADSTIKQEGTGSIKCANGDESKNDVWYKNISSEDWSSYTTVGFWLRASGTIATNGNPFRFQYDDTANLASALESITIGITSADTWEYKTLTLGATTRTAVISYGFNINSNVALDSINVWSDYFLLGPSTPVVTGTGPWNIDVIGLSIANGNTITVTYGSGGGASGVTNSSSTGVHTFTTKSRTAVTGTLTNIASSPTVTLSSGTTNDQLMRHGKWFNSGAEQPFTF